MKDEDGVEYHTKRYNSRTLYLGPYWWATMTRLSRNQIYCIHNINLETSCTECENDGN